MKVFIITEGGRRVGFGHITRCISLYDAFGKIGISPIFIINGDLTVKGLLKNEKYKIFNWLKEENKVLRLITAADIVIVDSYLADLKFYNKVSRLARLAVYVDDYKRLEYPKGIVINGSIYAKKMSYPKKVGLTYLTGGRYVPLRKEFWSAPVKKIRQRVGSLMVAFGGDDSRGMMPKILRFLNEEYPNLTKNVIIGAGFSRKNVRVIEASKGRNVNLIYYPNAVRIKNIMFKSDIAISAGGQMLYELARIGVPAIGIAIADNQLRNVNGWEKAGFLEYAGWYDDKNITSRVKKAIKNLNDFKTRENRRETGSKLIDGRGALRISDILCKKLKKI